MAVAYSPQLPLLRTPGPEPKRPVELRFHLLLLAAAVLLGWLLDELGPAWAQIIFEQVRLDSLGGVSALLAALLVSAVVHEMGHLIAALCLDYEVLGARLGPLRWERWQQKWKIWISASHWAHCSISAVPRQMPNRWRTRMLMVVGAGPVTSFLLMILAACLAVSAAQRIFGISWMASFWGSCAEVNLFVFALGLVPNSRRAKVPNDAALWVAIWRDDESARDLFACHQAIELGLRGIRPKQYSTETLAQLAHFPGRAYTRLMVARRFLEWAIDANRLPLAQAWDEAALAAAASCGKQWANRTLAESACFDVLFREDFPSALEKFAAVNFGDLFPPALAERAAAARLLASGLPEQVGDHLTRAFQALPAGDRYYCFEKMLLERLKKKARRQARAAKA